ncbi:MAG: ricin-type beta-trefoil lectin domain protein [Brevundimonas sp.]
MLGTGLVAATAVPANAASTCSALFDDFSYSSSSDGALTANGWQARSNAGGPGVAGAQWSPNNISFPTVDGSKAARLTAYTDGTAAGTSQAELLTTARRFQNGTYASRIKFTDGPASGNDGDHVNETFFAIGPAQRYDYDPEYSELDFTEYLPNGGWGVGGPIAYQTSYNGYRLEPWDPHNKHSQQTRSYSGWHTVVTTVADGHVKYYIDGTLLGDHTVDEQTGQYPVAPRVKMSVNFNLWFIDTAAHTGGRSTYTQDVDWFYYAKDQVISPSEAASTAASLQAAGTARLDTLDSGTCGGGGGGTGSGNTVVSNWNNKCIDVPGFRFNPGQALDVWDCNNGSNQKWEFTGGTLRSQNNLCLDAAGAATANGTVIQVATCNGNTAQQFTLRGDGSLLNARSGRCVDIGGWNGSNGAALILWDCNGQANQSWRRV